MKRRNHAFIERLESRQLLAGTGLRGEYFDNKDFTSSKLTRTDTQVNFDWANNSPASSIAPDTFSVRWTGQVIATKTESFTFHTSTDDGVRLWIGGQLVIDKLINGAQTTYSSKPIALTAGQPVDVRMDYYDNSGKAIAKLYWSSSTTPKTIIPTANLYPDAQDPDPDPPPPPPPPPVPNASAIRIDAAGVSTYTDSNGVAWSADRYYSGGSSSLGLFNISGTTDDAFYATRRFGKSFTYAIPVASGQYAVNLLFADASYDKGGRLIDVSVEGKLVLDNFDIVGEAGKGSAITKTFNVNVTDGKLSLQFTGVKNNATLSAIEVVPLDVAESHIDWDQVASSPVKRAEANGAVVNGKLYVLGGYISRPGGVIEAQLRCDVYNPANNTWTRIADMPEPMTHTGYAVDGDTIWLVGGYYGNHPGPGTSGVWKYNTITDTWSPGPSLPEKRGAGAAAIIGRTLHFVGGMDESRTIECGEHWSLDLDNPTANWTELAPMPNPRNHIGAASIDGKLYAIGGQHGQEEAQDAIAQVDCYNPATDSWTTVASMPGTRSHIVESTFVMNNQIIVLGGEIAYETQKNTVFAYDAQMNKWSLLGTLPANRSTSVAGALNNNRLITSTGNGPYDTAETWIGILS